MKKLSMSCLLVLGLLTGYHQTSYAIEALSTPTGTLYWNKEKAFNGYTIISPNTGTNTYLIDMEGNVVHTWDTEYRPGLYAEILPNGNIVRGYRTKDLVPFGGAYTGIQELDWNGKVVWEFKIESKDRTLHHCFKRLENGNTLLLTWSRKTIAEAEKKGRMKGTIPARDSREDDGIKWGEFWPDSIIEVDKNGKEVWQWNMWDNIGEGNDKLNINYFLPTDNYYRSSDWSHCNSLDYIPETNQIILCSRNFGEIFLINKATGKIEYRFGNPTTHNSKAIKPSWCQAGDQQLFGPHNATWLGDNKILIFDNGWQNPEKNRSRAVIFDIKQNKIIWEYKAVNMNGFYSAYQGAAQKLPNGNILITSTNTGHMIEVTCTDKPEVVWEYISPWVGDTPRALLTEEDGTNGGHNIMKNYTHRSYRYSSEYNGLIGKDLSQKKVLFPDAPKMYELYTKLRAMEAK